MEIVEIPTTFLFGELMKKLCLPSPEYKTEITMEGKLITSVAFYPSALCLQLASGSIQLSGDPMVNLEDANNAAATQAIKYMEKTQGKRMKDYNYEELDKKRKTEQRHIQEMIETNRKYTKIIREKDQKIKDTTRYWDDFVVTVSNVNDKIDRIAQAGYTFGTSQLDYDTNYTLSEIQEGTKHLNQLTFESTDLLRKIGIYPYDTDSDVRKADEVASSSVALSPLDNVNHSLDDDFVYDGFGRCSMDYPCL